MVYILNVILLLRYNIGMQVFVENNNNNNNNNLLCDCQMGSAPICKFLYPPESRAPRRLLDVPDVPL